MSAYARRDGTMAAPWRVPPALRPRLIWLSVFLVVNLAIIGASIVLWVGGLRQESLFVGLWAPTLNSLFVMSAVTLDPWRRTAPASPAGATVTVPVSTNGTYAQPSAVRS